MGEGEILTEVSNRELLGKTLKKENPDLTTDLRNGIDGLKNASNLQKNIENNQNNGGNEGGSKIKSIVSALKKNSEGDSQQRKTEQGGKSVTLSEEDFRKCVVGGNPTIIRLPSDKEKEFGADEKIYHFKEVNEGEVRKSIEDLFDKKQKVSNLNVIRGYIEKMFDKLLGRKEKPKFEKEILEKAYSDLKLKKQQFDAINGIAYDRQSKFLFNELNLKEMPVFVEGVGFCEVSKEGGKVALKGIQGYLIKDDRPMIVQLPDYAILTPHILESEIIPAVSEVTGVTYDKLKEDFDKGKIRSLFPGDIVKSEYGMIGYRGYASYTHRYSFSRYLGDAFDLGTSIHEITHLEDARGSMRTGIIGLIKKLDMKGLIPDDYSEAAAMLAFMNGLRKVANVRKDIGLRQEADNFGVLMVGTWIGSYLKDNKVPDKKIFGILDKMGLGGELISDIFGRSWKDGKISNNWFKKIKKYRAVAYDMIKYFGEDVQVLKISKNEWKKFIREKDSKKLFTHELSADVSDYDKLINYGGESGLGMSTKEWLHFFGMKQKILNKEKEMLTSRNPFKLMDRYAMGERLKERGTTKEKRLKTISEEMDIVDKKIAQISKDDWKNVKFEDLSYRIR